ncbi:MAG: flagellar protein FliS [Acidobacteria bacterium]|nr:flagellar protein FliS [Acidobacteriota bacterium]
MSAQQYVDNEALHVNPVELICLLYSKAIEKLHKARTCFEGGENSAANEAVAFTMEIVAELQGSLSEEGGEIAANLADLYGYIQQRLAEVLVRGDPKPLLEAIRLLTTLHQGWNEIRESNRPPPAASLAGTEAAASAGRTWTL